MVRSFPRQQVTAEDETFYCPFWGNVCSKVNRTLDEHPRTSTTDLLEWEQWIKKSTPKNVGANITSGGCFIIFFRLGGTAHVKSRDSKHKKSFAERAWRAQWASNLWAIKARFFLRFPFPCAADALQLVFPRRPRSGLNYGVKSPLNDRKNDLLLENLAQQLFVAFVFATVNSIIAVIIALLQHKPPGLFGCFWGVTASMDC